MTDLLIRDLDPETHAELRGRAAAEGLSLQAYVTRLLRGHTERPSMTAWLARLDELVAVETPTGGAAAVAAARDELP